MPSKQDEDLELRARQVLEPHWRSEQARKKARRARYSVLVWISRLLLLAVVLVVWEFASKKHWVDPMFFSMPSEVFPRFWNVLSDALLWDNFQVTIRETLLGFSIGSLGGVVVGLLLSQVNFLSSLAAPYITILNSIPRVALAPIFIIWFGIGELSKVVLAVSLVFFVVVITTEAGSRAIEDESVRIMRVIGASKWQTFWLLRLPGALPSIFGALRLGVIYALLGVTFGEMLASKAGLGVMLQQYASTFDVAGTLSTLLYLVALALLLTTAVSFVERRSLRWREDD